MYSRSQVIDLLKPVLMSHSDIIAVWEAGSAATGFVDQYSDLDISVICNDASVEIVFALITDFLDKTFGIQNQYRVPEPTWHGFSQTFYKIDNVGDYFYLDVGVIKRSLPNKFMETDRHGTAIVWFEKEPMYFPSLTPASETEARVAAALKQALKIEFLFTTELKKAIARQNIIDIHSQLMTYLARVAAPIFNAVYRPAKVDFGLRYIARDYPPNLVYLIEQLLTENNHVKQAKLVDELFSQVAKEKTKVSFYIK